MSENQKKFIRELYWLMQKYNIEKLKGNGADVEFYSNGHLLTMRNGWNRNDDVFDLVIYETFEVGNDQT